MKKVSIILSLLFLFSFTTFAQKIKIKTGIEVLKEQNFKYIGSFDQLKAPINKEILQQDAIFINTNFISNL